MPAHDYVHFLILNKIQEQEYHAQNKGKHSKSNKSEIRHGVKEPAV